MLSRLTRSPILGSEWTLNSAPAAATRASAVRAAAGVGVRNVMDSFTASVAAVNAQVILNCTIRDGAYLAGVVIWQMLFKVVTASTHTISLSNLNLVGSPNTAMTIEFLTAPAAGNFQSVSALGFTVL
jgi:hypothetical protein